MVHVHTYHLKPTPLIPNSPHPLLHYPGLLLDVVQKPDFNGSHIDDIFRSNGWHTQWIVRYGRTQGSHYHSHAHECMAVISGEGATIRFGRADTSEDLEESTYGDAYEKNAWEEEDDGPGDRGVLELKAGLGDVFLIPAGVAHKTFNVRPSNPDGVKQMASQDGHLSERDVDEARKRLAEVKVDGFFMMCGAYPVGQDWDWKDGWEGQGERVRFEDVWAVELPERDPVFGVSEEGLCGLWKSEGTGSGSEE